MLTDEIWQTALGQLQMQMTRATFDTWVKNSHGLAYEDGTFVVGVASGYAKDWLENRLHSTIKRTLTGILGRSVEVRYAVWSRQAAEQDGQDGVALVEFAGQRSQPAESASESASALAAASGDGQDGQDGEGDAGDAGGGAREAGPGAEAAESPFEVTPMLPNMNGNGQGNGSNGATTEGLSARYTFDSFVVGTSNRLAHAAALAVAANPARAYNPLFIYGGVGLGKTHLLQAIGHASRELGLRVMYVSSEQFTNDLIAAIKARATDRFRDRYRTTDVLLVDDIQFIAGKESTQEEFFHTFNSLHGQERQIVISSDRPPKALVTLEDRLRSRFEWGLIADIQPPDLETRIAILQQKGEALHVEVAYEVLERIARQIQSNIRELEGALNRVVAHARLTGLELSPDLVTVALADLMPRPGSVSMKDILAAVAAHYQVSVSDLTGRSRTAELVEARHVAMYLARTELSASLPHIGHELGGRDHTTVIHACEKITDQLERNDALRRGLGTIRERIYSRAPAR